MLGALVAALLPAVGAAALVLRGRRPVTDVDLTAWAIRFDVLLTRELRPVAAARLRRARSWRSGAMAVGVLIGGLPLVVTAIAPAAASSFNTPATSMAWLTAAAIGALVAEATVAQRPQRPGRAVMIRRSTSDYVSIRWIRLVVGSVPVAVVLAVLSSFEEPDPWGRAAVWLAIPETVLAAAAVLIGGRLLSHRPMLGADDGIRRLDEAFRADGAHHVVGAAVALAWWACASSLGVLLGAPWNVLTALASWLGVAAWWTLARDARWNVDLARMRSA